MRLASIILCMLYGMLLAGCGQEKPAPKFVRKMQLETRLLADPVAVLSVHNTGSEGRIEILVEREDRSQIWRTEEYFGNEETRDVRVPLPGCPYPVKLMAVLRLATGEEAADKETTTLSWGN